MTLLEALQKTKAFLDKAVAEKPKLISNLQYGVKLVQAIRSADLGNDTNAILDELIVVGQQLETLAGAPQVPPVA